MTDETLEPVEPITKIEDYLDEDWIPTDEKNARYKMTYEFDLNGNRTNTIFEVLLEDQAQETI
jgi:hypothetical protein